MKIKSSKLIKLSEKVPVYDIEVSETSNFKLAAGVVVHNSKDISDALIGSIYSCQENSTYSKAYNDEMINSMKSTMNRDSQKGLTKIIFGQ